MADSKISALTGATTPLAGTEALPVVQGGVTKQVTVANLTVGRDVSMVSATVTGDLTVDTTTLKVDSTNNRVGIGTASPAVLLQVRGGNPDVYITSDNTGQSDIYFGGSTAPTKGRIQYSDNSDFMALWTASAERFKIDSSGNVTVATGNLVIGTAAKGIDFTANTPAAGMTSQLLDDYEEGTWTPSLWYATPGDSSFTYGTQLGTYTKIGNTVVVSLTIVLTAFSKGTASGTFRVQGLPFASSGTHFFNASMVLANQSFTGIPGARTSPGTTNLNLRQYSSASAGGNMADPSATSEFYITLVYQV